MAKQSNELVHPGGLHTYDIFSFSSNKQKNSISGHLHFSTAKCHLPFLSLVKLGLPNQSVDDPELWFRISLVSHPCNPKHQSVDPIFVGMKDMKVDILNLHTLTCNKPVHLQVSAKVRYVS